MGSKPIRVAVDVRGWSPRTRGTDVYLANLLTRWAHELDAEWSLILSRTGDADAALPMQAPVVRLSHASTRLSRLPLMGGAPDAIGRSHDAVFLPNLAVYYRRPRAPLVLMVHDALALLHPEYFTEADRRWHEQVRPDALMRTADRILANSQQTLGEIGALGVDESKVEVVPLGIDDACRPADEHAVAAVRAKHAIPDGPYFVSLGAVEPRKNVAALIRGFNRARSQGLQASLVIAGGVHDQAQVAEAGEGVLVLGWIDADDKVPLLSGALGFVSLADYEGFGIVPLEALACGTRPLLKKLPIYDETVGHHASYVESDEEDVVASALLEQAHAPQTVSAAERDTLLARFSWDRCAADSLAVIRAAAAG